MKLLLTIAVSLAVHAALLALPCGREREPVEPAESLQIRTLVFREKTQPVQRPVLSPMPHPGTTAQLPEQHPLPETMEFTVEHHRFELPARLEKRGPVIWQTMNTTLASLPQKLPISPPFSQATRAQTGGEDGASSEEPASIHTDLKGSEQRDFGSLDGPGFDTRVLPEYPHAARRTGREGTVLLSLTIDARGGLTRVTVMQSAGRDLDRAALRAVRASTFIPARRDGRAVASTATLPIRFELRGP